MLLDVILIILPIIPASFFVYVIKVFLNNLKRKERLDYNLKNNISVSELNNYMECDNIELKKKKK